VNDSNADSTGLELLPYDRKRSFGTDKMVNHVNKANQIEEVIFEKAIFIEEFGNICARKALDCVSFCDCYGFEAIEFFKAVIPSNFEQETYVATNIEYALSVVNVGRGKSKIASHRPAHIRQFAGRNVRFLISAIK
jgi:hypothetical protein